jgi:hypothetical protein
MPVPALDGGLREVPTVLFVGGYARSGSTVLDILLGTTEGFCSAGELRFIWQRGFVEDQRCACGQRFSRCPFWNRVADVGFGGMGEDDVDGVLRWQARVDRWWRVPQLRGQGRGGIANDLESYLDTMDRFYRAIAQVSGSRVIVDSSKDASHGYLLGAMGSRIDLRVVHLVRDSRAVAYSLCERRKYDPGSGRELGGHGYLRAAAGWSMTNLLVEAMRTGGRLGYVRLAYEDFAEDPERALRRIVAFAGGDEGSLAFHDRNLDLGSEHHTVAGNPMRFERGNVEIRPDETWRVEMTRRGRWTVGALTWPLRLRYASSGV